MGAMLGLKTSREEYWIMKVQKLARKIVKFSVKRPQTPPMADLPQETVTPAKPFLINRS